MGEILLNNLKQIIVSDKVKEIRGKGLFIGLQFIESDYAEKLSKILLKNGLIAKPTQRNIIRFSPPLIITKEQVQESLNIIEKSWAEVKKTL